MSPPRQNRGKSEQIVRTPKDFLDAVRERFGRIDFDLACTLSNCVADSGTGYFHDRGIDALTQDWREHHDPHNTLWLNPPFSKIAPWAAKCAEMRDHLGRILLLTPASIGSNWYRDHIHGKAYVLALASRIKFVGHQNQFPKDLILSVFGAGMSGFEVWDWKASLP
jgi:phage N-6-adenine-methyltransferase